MFRIEKVLISLALGAVFPIIGFLAVWWGTFSFLPEKYMLPAVSAGFMIGFLIDILYLKKWIRSAYSTSLTTWMAVYGFYSLGILGFFMGVPVFNVALAIPAGLFIGARLARHQADTVEQKRLTRKTCVFTTSVLAVVCLFSAFAALKSPYTGGELASMFALSFKITKAMLGGIIVVGGCSLLLLQWSVTAAVIRRTYTAIQTKTGFTQPAAERANI